MFASPNQQDIEVADGAFQVESVRAGHPRLFLEEDSLSALRNPQSPELEEFMRFFRQTGEAMLSLPPVKRELVGYRMLLQSRLALKRIPTWALLYLIDDDERFLERAKREIEAAISFTDWNPRHYLDVGEMALAVSIGVDWLWEDLEPEFRQHALEAIRTKGILPSLDAEHPYNWWLHDDNNWNPVCNSGLIAGALLLAESHPELSEQVINRALKIVPNALAATDPDGLYLEGPSYWEYGTAFTALLIELLEKATGSSYGLAQHYSFQKSIDFRVMAVGPSGRFYNFYDSGSSVSLSPTLSWFANYYQNPLARYETQRLMQSFLDDPDMTPGDDKHRLLAFQALWFLDAATTATESVELPQHWSGGGPNAVTILRENWTDPNAFFLAFKAGNGQISHAHQDAGSFILEDEGVRWAVDLGAQRYNSLESLGLNIWDRRQHSDRWRVFRIGSYSHNILLVDERPQDVNGTATISVEDNLPNRFIGTVDLSEIYQDQCSAYTREFVLHDFQVLEINDRIAGTRAAVGRQGRSPATLHWRMVTHADISVENGIATLSQDGKQLFVSVADPENAIIRNTSLETPPYYWDAPNPDTRALDVWLPAMDDGSRTLSIFMSTDLKALQKHIRNRP